ncbi:MAG: S49 family peptidase [Desulfococcaceae bacterium]
MSGKEIWKAPFKIFGMTFFALVSFVVLLFLFSLFFVGAGAGLGAMVGKQSLSAIPSADRLSVKHFSGDPSSKNLLLRVPVSGIILGSPTHGMSDVMAIRGITYGYRIKDILAEAAEDDQIKGVLLHLQTPGGTIYGARAIFEAVESFQETTGRPVFAFVEGISASGGVIAMAGADRIFADFGSRVGSIGVLGGMLTYFDDPVATNGGLLGQGIETRGGIEHTIISAGRGKDLGNPFRRPTEDEISVLQEGANQEYERFVRLVAENRPITESVIRETLGALIFGNDSAESYGLIDGTRNREEAVSELAAAAGVAEDYQLVTPRTEAGPFWRQLLSGWSNRDAADLARQDLCRAVARLPLAYAGDVVALCEACRKEGSELP